MTAKDDLRNFLATRRARLTPQQAGLPVYGANRRVAGLRREEVALLAGISVEYYTRLERGNVGAVSDSVLDGVCHALQLDHAERDHLRRLVRAVVTPRAPAARLRAPAGRRRSAALSGGPVRASEPTPASSPGSTRWGDRAPTAPMRTTGGARLSVMEAMARRTTWRP